MALEHDSADKYVCLKVTDKKLAGKIDLRIPISYGDKIAQIPVASGNQNFLYVHVNTQSFLLEGRGYRRLDDETDKEMKKVLEAFLG